MSLPLQFGVSFPQARYKAQDVTFSGRRILQFSFSYKLLILFLLVLYSNIARQFPALEAVRPAQLVASVALLALVAERALSWQHFELVWPESYMALAFLGAAGLSVFNALWVPWALQSVGDLAKMIAIFFLIVNVVDNEKRLRAIAWVMVLGGMFPALGALRFWMNGIVVEGRARWLGIFANPNELGYSLVVLIPLAAALAVGRPLFWRALLWGGIGVYMMVVYLTLSRGALMGLLTVLALLGWRQKSNALRMAFIVGIAASMMFAAFWWSRGEGFANLGSDTNVQQRLATYKAGFEMFMDRPLLGVGIGCSSIAWPLYAPSGFYARHWLHIHNTFLQALCESGLLGLIPFVLFIGFAVWHARKLRLQEGRPELGNLPLFAGALEVSLWGFIVCGLSGGFVLSWFPYILVGLVCCAKKIADCFPAPLPVANRFWFR